jgi:hypothetical protein
MSNTTPWKADKSGWSCCIWPKKHKKKQGGKKKGRRGGGDLEGEEGKVIPKKYYFNRVENDLDV